MLAKRLPTILTPLPPAESLQTTRIDAEDSQVLPAPQVDVSLTHVRRRVPDGQDVADHHFLVRHAGVIEPCRWLADRRRQGQAAEGPARRRTRGAWVALRGAG